MAEKKAPSWAEQFSALKNLPRFFKLIWDTSASMTVGNVLLRLLSSAIPLSMLYIGKLIIDEVVHLVNNNSQDLTQLWIWLALEFGLAISSDLISRGISLLDSLLGDLFANSSSEKLIRHAAKLDLYQFENADFYDKLERARRQTVGRVMLMSQVLSQVQDMVTLIFLGVGLVVFNPWLLLILVVAVIPSFIGETYFNEKTYSISKRWTPERRELDYLRYIGASDETAKEIKIFNLSEFLASRFKEISDRYYITNKKLNIKRAWVGTLLSALGTIAYYGAFIFILIETVAGILTLGDLTFLSGSFSRMRGLLQTIMGRFSSIAQGALYLQDLFDFFAIEPDIVSGKNSLEVPSSLKEGFVFENVGFKYPESENWAIRNVSFHLKPDEKLALVGENGAGKTTLVKLLARLYDPSEGRILLDGKDLKEYSLQSLREAIGIIFQDFVRFQISASDNIAIGQIQERGNDELIENAAYKSLADKVITKLPNSYQQVLGKRFSGGVDLSGGEWQKIALSRAYMRDARLVILDEPTAALDARAEHEVFVRFSELIEGKAAVLISHRFSTVRMADRILLLENGRKKELGTHQELLELGGKYAELFNLQAKGYK